MSANVYQFNDNYGDLVDLVQKVNPNIFLTLESNKDWDKGISEIESQFSSMRKIPLENTYGMHFYTNLETKEIKEYYFISENRPAIEAHLVDSVGNEFVFWGLHPPPPSPSEKPTSKQKDAELMCVSKIIAESEKPNVVAGDFNNVCWSPSSKLFAKIANIKDARIRKGIHGTFPVKPGIFRFPIDLLFHSKGISVTSLKTLEDFGSDHLPLFSRFAIEKNHGNYKTEIENGDNEVANRIIEEGKEANKVEKPNG